MSPGWAPSDVNLAASFQKIQLHSLLLVRPTLKTRLSMANNLRHITLDEGTMSKWRIVLLIVLVFLAIAIPLAMTIR